jgi:hypothetical protein
MVHTFVVFAQAARDDKPRDSQAERIGNLKGHCRHRQVAIGGFARDGDPVYHELQKA